MDPLIAFALNLALFFLAHSLLASNRLKEALRSRTPRLAAWYRLGYNLLFLTWSAVLVGQYLQMERHPLVDWSPWLRAFGLVPATAGLLIMRSAFRSYDWGEFVGTRYLRTGGRPVHTHLETEGWNRCIRHPLYLGTLLLIWGMVWLSPNDALLTFALVTSAYLPLGIWSEERKLEAEFGETYRQYKARTPMLFPRPDCLRRIADDGR